jgi:parallel beta-helix repeat protein
MNQMNDAFRVRKVCFFAFLFACIFITSVQAESKVVSRVSHITAGPDVQYQMQSRLIDAVPGDVIQLAAGIYRFHRQLDITTSHLTIRGAGSDKTVLSFKGQSSGGAGIEATGGNLMLEGFAVEDTAGNAIKVLGADGVTFRDIRTEWTGPPRQSNGAYGIYPVQCRNVLLENCTAIGASDAGVYVGQCHNVIVRKNRAERNVAGIEIENTVGADVYENVSTNNTGGILVFDLPGLQVKAGGNIRVHKNSVVGNNHPNFAAKGNVVADVPPGTGIMVMSTDLVEVFDNDIDDHQTGGVALLSYQARKKGKDKTFDPFPESLSVHDNRITKSGYKPAGKFGALLAPLLGGTLADILWDGVVNPAKMVKGKLAPSQIPSIKDNGDATFVNFDQSHLNPQDILQGRLHVVRELTDYQLNREPIAPTKLAEPGPIKPADSSAVLVYRSAKQHLSQYNLFAGRLADQAPAEDVIPYDLSMPLFSDYTSKYRFIRLPEGKQIEYRDEGVLQFPVGTLIAKTFAYPLDMTDLSKGQRLLETRIEFRREDGWFGFSYRWNDEQTDAHLVLGGGEVEVSWIHTDGRERTNDYQIPNANQCLNCHKQGEQYVPIGPVATNMNHDFDFGHGRLNQITNLRQRNAIVGGPEIDAVGSWPAERSLAADADFASVQQHARTWLHVNCAHCHSPVGTARTSGLDLRLTQTDPLKLGIHKPPVAAGHGSGGRGYDIVPGKPEKSILMYRIESADPGIAMPSVAKRMVPVEAASVVRRWITGMKE